LKPSPPAKPSKEQAIRTRANGHYTTESELESVHRLYAEQREEDPQELIKLLEVSPSTIGVGIEPLYFSAHPSSGIPYPIIIVEVTPDEFAQIRSGELPLPHDWRLGSSFPRQG
jgi:hypothetical protein